jgi:hypothetical protein
LWNALWALKARLDIIGKLNAAVVDALADATVRQRGHDRLQIWREQQTPEALVAS